MLYLKVVDIVVMMAKATDVIALEPLATRIKNIIVALSVTLPQTQSRHAAQRSTAQHTTQHSTHSSTHSRAHRLGYVMSAAELDKVTTREQRSAK